MYALLGVVTFVQVAEFDSVMTGQFPQFDVMMY